jgi:hypothetical protein
MNLEESRGKPEVKQIVRQRQEQTVCDRRDTTETPVADSRKIQQHKKSKVTRI